MFRVLIAPIFASMLIFSTKLHAESLFKCPEISEFSQGYTLSGVLESPLLLEVVSASALPPKNAFETAWRQFFVQSLPKIEKHFGTYPRMTKLIVTDQISPLSALFCASAQSGLGEFAIFISPDLVGTPSELSSTIAHEFIHYYFFKAKSDAPTWYEEGLALYFEYLVTRQLKGAAISKHLETPWIGLNAEFKDHETALSVYGHAQLLFLYLHNHLGENLIHELLTSGKVGVAALESVAKKSGLWNSLDQMYTEFQIAKYVNRIDYLAPPARQKRFFLFSTTLRAKRRSGFSDSASNCVIVHDSLTEPISYRLCNLSEPVAFPDFIINLRARNKMTADEAQGVSD